jgi:hypothetical protein
MRNVEFLLAGDFGLLNYEVVLFVFVNGRVLLALKYALIFRQIWLVLELELVQALLEVASSIVCLNFILLMSVKATFVLMLFFLAQFFLILLDKLFISLFVAKSRYRRFLLAPIAGFIHIITHVLDVFYNGLLKLFVQF